jgi:hypothetical protein
MRTAVSLPGRVVTVEDQGRALEARVVARLEEVRYELAEIRRLLGEMAEAETEAVELTGRLLLGTEGRLRALEDQADWPAPELAHPTPRELPSA